VVSARAGVVAEEVKSLAGHFDRPTQRHHESSR
jgi:hypothetical protein